MFPDPKHDLIFDNSILYYCFCGTIASMTIVEQWNRNKGTFTPSADCPTRKSCIGGKMCQNAVAVYACGEQAGPPCSHSQVAEARTDYNANENK